MAGYWEKLSYIASKIATDALPLLTVFAVLSALFGVASWLSYSKNGKIVAKHNTLFVVAIAFIACVIGYTTTNSRTPILGEVLPLILTGLGALFGIGYVQSRIERSLLAVAVVVFSVAVFIGMTLGGVNRQAHEAVAPQIAETAQGAQGVSPTPQTVAQTTAPPTGLTSYTWAIQLPPGQTPRGGLIISGSGFPTEGDLAPTPTPTIGFGPTWQLTPNLYENLRSDPEMRSLIEGDDFEMACSEWLFDAQQSFSCLARTESAATSLQNWMRRNQ